MKTLIQDTNTKEFYSIAYQSDKYGNPTDVSDYHYYSSDIEDAYDFSNKYGAELEIRMNDVDDSGKRTIEIIEA